MMIFKLAFRNLMAAGLRTWLNVLVLSFAFVLMVFYNALIDGWRMQGMDDTRQWEIGGGQYWHPEYKQYDPFTLSDAHAVLSDSIDRLIAQGVLTPQLMITATVYPHGRMQNAVLVGVDPQQKILGLPMATLQRDSVHHGVVIGKRMAEALQLGAGDRMMLRWRDSHGTFDAREVYIGEVFSCDVPSVDNGRIYLPLQQLQAMTGMAHEATLLVLAQEHDAPRLASWRWQSATVLLQDLEALVQSERVSSMVFQLTLLLLALLAVFDTQVLSVFRRHREIGTYIALGMTRQQVVGIFTVEGAAHSILAAGVGTIYGVPVCMYINTIGISFGMPDVGITMADIIYPYYSVQLIVWVLLLVVISSTIVSYIPARRIAKLKPTDALKGKLS